MKNNYQKNYDSKSDSLWIVFKTGPEAYFEEVVPGVNLEFDNKDQLIGIEILDYTQKTVDYSTKITSQLLAFSERTIDLSRPNFNEDTITKYFTTSPKNNTEINYSACLQ